MMTLLARLIMASMTWTRRSAQIMSFLKPGACHEMVRPPPKEPGLQRFASFADHPITAQFREQGAALWLS